MQDDQFEWDDEKARSNLAKHGVDFADARLVFVDPGYIDDPDDSVTYGEERYRAIGFAGDKLLTVFYTLRGHRYRLISARQASRQEKENYARENPPI